MNSRYTTCSSSRLFGRAVLVAVLCLNFNLWKPTTANQQNPLEEATLLDRRVQELNEQGKYDEALPLAERVLRLREDNLDANNPLISRSLTRLAKLVQMKGDFDRAETLLQRALRIGEKSLGPDDHQVAYVLMAIAGLQQAKGEYGRALQSISRSVAIREPLNDPGVIPALSNMATLYQNLGRFDEAKQTLLRALAIHEKLFAAANPDRDSSEMLSIALGNLAALYEDTGDYVNAEKYFLQSLKVQESVLGKEHPRTAITQNNLALLYQLKGDSQRAQVMLMRSLEIVKKAHNDAENLDVTIVMNNLADVYKVMGDLARAEEMLTKVLAIRERVYRGEHPDVAKSLTNLAVVYGEKGDAERAGQLMQRALLMNEKLLGPEHPDVANTLRNLGMIYKQQGAFTLAEKFLLRTLQINRKALGDKHPDVAVTLYSLAALYQSKGDAARAIDYMASGDAIREYNLALILAGGSERQKQLYLQTLTGEAFQTISCQINAAATNQQAMRLALTTVLRRKGRVLDTLTDQINSLRQHAAPQDKELLDQLAGTQSQLAKLRFAATGTNFTPQQRLALDQQLTSRLESLQAEISSRGAELRIQTQPVTLQAVQEALPAEAALVEIFSYRPFNAKATTNRFGAARYVAYVLKKDSINFVDLGPVKTIDKASDRFLTAISNPANLNAKQTARALDEIVARPIRNLLGSVQNILISPDGELNLVPFAGLVDEHGKYLVEKYNITYLTSGRDLLRLNVPRQSNEVAIVIANPAFDLAIPKGQTMQKQGETRGRRSGDMSTNWRKLPGTKQEADHLQKILPNARVLTDKAATEGALKELTGPRILHLATHGFFLTDQPSNSVDKAMTTRENPLLRSGLVLAGANTFQGGGNEDGVLTALEAAGLNLWGTQLVVLSACDTGVGDVRSGEGVYGLRRALVLAGTESQIMTLWKVNDRATGEFNIEYYERLLAGEGRSDALRRVQLDFLGRKTTQHPFYWASFILNGEWRSISMSR